MSIYQEKNKNVMNIKISLKQSYISTKEGAINPNRGEKGTPSKSHVRATYGLIH